MAAKSPRPIGPSALAWIGEVIKPSKMLKSVTLDIPATTRDLLDGRRLSERIGLSEGGAVSSFIVGKRY
jgi:hypothetical protein